MKDSSIYGILNLDARSTSSGKGRSLPHARPSRARPRARAAAGPAPSGPRAPRRDRRRTVESLAATRRPAPRRHRRLLTRRRNRSVLPGHLRRRRPDEGRAALPHRSARRSGTSADGAPNRHGMTTARVRALLPRRSDWAAARRAPVRDLVAGSTVALVALPLALAFGVTSGLGAEAGLITAIVAGAVAAVFGGSNLQVSGPTGAMTVVIVPVVHQFGPHAVLMVGAMSGVILIALALARVGRYVRYLPMPVIEGFTAGIAVVIALQQVPATLGASGPARQKGWQKPIDAISHFSARSAPAPLGIALSGAAAIPIG